jgi:hypothetical protein
VTRFAALETRAARPLGGCLATWKRRATRMRRATSVSMIATGTSFVQGAKVLVGVHDPDRVFPGESAVEVLDVPRNQRLGLSRNCSGRMYVVIGVRPVDLGDQPSVAFGGNAGVRKELPDRGGNRCGRVSGAVMLPGYHAFPFIFPYRQRCGALVLRHPGPRARRLAPCSR